MIIVRSFGVLLLSSVLNRCSLFACDYFYRNLNAVLIICFLCDAFLCIIIFQFFLHFYFGWKVYVFCFHVLVGFYVVLEF